MSDDAIWQAIRTEAENDRSTEPALEGFLRATILDHNNFEAALSFLLASKLSNSVTSADTISEIFQQALSADPGIAQFARADIEAILQRDSACEKASIPFLFFKGFHALQAYRIAHWMWQQNRRELALFLQHRISVVFSVDIHPAARIGKGIMFDHATGIVIGETAVVEDNVSIMQSVTLGGTGKESDDRHPKVRANVMIGAGSKILGNIEVGEGAKVCAGSVVLKPVAAHTTVTGVPAKVVGQPQSSTPALDMDQKI